jgi:hypothetical protein
LLYQLGGALRWAPTPGGNGNQHIANSNRIERHQVAYELVSTLGFDAVAIAVPRQEVSQVVGDDRGSSNEDGSSQHMAVAGVIGHGVF